MNGVTAIISPYNHPTVEGRRDHLIYAKAAAFDCLVRGEAPAAIHLILGDANEEEDPNLRRLALSSSECFLDISARAAVYTDFGISAGMKHEIEYAESIGRDIEYRSLIGYIDIPVDT